MISLFLSLIVGFVDPVYAFMAEEACLYDPYGEGFDGTNDIAVEATARYETFIHMHDGEEIPKLGPGERIVVVDVEVRGTFDGLCRLHCTSLRCIYAVEVLCGQWGCSSQHLLHEGEDRTRCIGGEQLL
jgi:hypothetical protein